MSVTTLKLNLYLTSHSSVVEKTIHGLGIELGLVNKKQRDALKVLLSNLFVYSDRKIVVSRKKQSLGPTRYNPHNIGYRSQNTVLDRLFDNGLITQDKGHKNLATGEGKQTTIESTEALRARFFMAEWSTGHFDYQNPELIRLKEYDKVGPSKKLIDYNDTAESQRLRQEVLAYYKLLNQFHISMSTEEDGLDWEYDGDMIYRSFIKMTEPGNFEYGGRLVGPWSNLTKKQRKHILIDGEETVEHDFQASHISTMYLMVTGKPYPGTDDPYRLAIENQVIPRHIVKKLSSIMINVKSYAAAIGAIENEYKKLGADGSNANEHADFEKINSDLTLVRVINAYLKKHAPIAGLFLKGKKMGNHIQYIESCRAMRIINHLVEKGIPVLTVFDSFLVADKHEDVLLAVMNDESIAYDIAA